MEAPIEAWKGSFGDAYHARQTDMHAEAAKREMLWAHALDRLPRLRMDILEVGAGTGANLEAIRRLRQMSQLTPTLFALEPNEKAAASIPGDVALIYGTADRIEAASATFDLVFTYGVLIHLEDPLAAMREMYRVSKRYVMCAEYFAPKREAIPYRDGVPLFRDDYGAFWMDSFDLKLLGYGFCWKRATGLDNVTWWMFEKT